MTDDEKLDTMLRWALRHKNRCCTFVEIGQKMLEGLTNPIWCFQDAAHLRRAIKNWHQTTLTARTASHPSP